jgi:hypothetical protein
MAPEVRAMRNLAFLLVFAVAPAQEEEEAAGRRRRRRAASTPWGLDWKAKPIDFTKVDRAIRKPGAQVREASTGSSSSSRASASGPC